MNASHTTSLAMDSAQSASSCDDAVDGNKHMCTPLHDNSGASGCSLSESFTGNVPNMHVDGEGSFSSFDDDVLDEDGEAIVARAMNSLSIEERSKALHDLHGVAEIEEDDPAIVNAKLGELEIELCRIPKKDAYYKAKATAPAYVADREFRLLFLRSDEMNARKAALRMVRHFEAKLQLFGPDKLGRDIRLADLNADDLKVLESGQLQWLPQRDRAGRAVLCWTLGAVVAPVENRFRAKWFGMMNALRDVETRKRGVVVVFMSLHGWQIWSSFADPHDATRIPEFTRSLPTRFVAFHACFDRQFSRPILDMTLRGLGTFLQVRYRAHYGTADECLYTLMTFGISGSSVPLNSDGSLKKDFHLQRLAKRKEQEKVSNNHTPKELVVIPGPFDVLLGRGKPSQENPGNLWYRSLIASYQKSYEQARKLEKTTIADEVIQQVKKSSGRFLTEYYADYVEISDVRARQKVSHSFRSLRLKQQPQTKSRTKVAAAGRPTSKSVSYTSDSSSSSGIPGAEHGKEEAQRGDNIDFGLDKPTMTGQGDLRKAPLPDMSVGETRGGKRPRPA